MDVEEGDHVTLVQRIAFHIHHLSCQVGNATHADVTRDDGIGHSRQLAVVEVHVGAAHLAVDRLQQDGPRFQFWLGELSHLQRFLRSPHDSGFDHNVSLPSPLMVPLLSVVGLPATTCAGLALPGSPDPGVWRRIWRSRLSRTRQQHPRGRLPLRYDPIISQMAEIGNRGYSDRHEFGTRF